MQQASRETMEKEVVVKEEDGRLLIYYRFRPAGSEPQQQKTASEGDSQA
jgi:hypothetical protein